MSDCEQDVETRKIDCVVDGISLSFVVAVMYHHFSTSSVTDEHAFTSKCGNIRISLLGILDASQILLHVISLRSDFQE